MRCLLFAAVLALAACGAPATQTAPSAETVSDQPAALEITDAWATATASGAGVSAGYMTITSPIADRLLSASTPRAARVEIHEMSMDSGVMRMRALDGGLSLSAGEVATLAPGGLHLMFMEADPPFAEGESVPVTLTFEQAGAVEVALPVRRGGGHGGH